ncbi:patatin-like serine hydrolase [Microthyrium microscopicum]|uniref:Lysophospholipase NTE1 n=1 Tax=Microthyrium microscopicum TaxID=703497 RepID=A0A6A6UPH9_9PEZI|nr:patatin-like serine hydrolase [Microthyrium microscopicum]
MPDSSSSTTEVLAWVIISIIKVVPLLLLRLVTFVTITVPSWLYTLLSVSLTVTINFSTLAFIGLAFLSTASYFIRYRYHSYARGPVESSRKDPEVEVPNPQTDNSKPGLSNYLDEFLSAIKVFGYLEKNVFHELTRTMHTRRLAAGETFLLEEEQGFCLVVEGSIQIFIKSQHEDSEDVEDAGYFSPDRHQGYQLLTEVQNGAPMSSLFSILSLFTEDITTKGHSDHSSHRRQSSMSSVPPRTPPHSVNNLSPLNGYPSPRGPTMAQLPRAYSQPSSLHASPEIHPDHLTQVPPLNLEPQADVPATPDRADLSLQLKRMKSAHPDIVARATQDSTIAIIPATAFKRLTRQYPKATAHIVQVILNRFYRVTLVTAQSYLGLTNEILDTEKRMTKYLLSELPSFLLGRPLDAIKETFSHEREVLGQEEVAKGIALHNPRTAARRRRSSSMKKELSAHVRITAARSVAHGGADPPSSPENERSGVSAGDLFRGSKGRKKERTLYAQPVQTPWQRVGSPMEGGNYFEARPRAVQRQEASEHGEMFRDAIFHAMCSAMGLKDLSNGPGVSRDNPLSPRLVSYDARKQKAVFNTVLGLMDPYEASNDNDSEANSTSASGITSSHSSHNVEDMIDDVEIVYFPQGTVLVDQQERLPGLYYVIDGFLEVGITLEGESSESNFLGTRDLMDEKRGHGISKKKKTSPKGHHRQSLHLVKPGSLAGYLPAISGFRSFVDVTAKSDVIVGFLPRKSLDKLVEKYPVVLLTLAKRLTSLLNGMILHIDFALEYLQVDAGHIIYEQDSPSDSIYIILNGRLRGIQQGDKKDIRVLGEYGQGDSVGELEVLTDAVRPGSLHAIRDTELAKLPKTLFNSLAQEHPAISMKMSKVLAKRMRTLMYNPVIDSTKERLAIGGAKNPSSTVNLRTVGIVPVRDGVPVGEFAGRLVNALTQIGISVILLNQTAIFKHLGHHAFSKMGKLKISQYLADLEERYGMVLYVADTSVQSPWTSTCVAQADCVLVVGVADDSPALGEYERIVLTAKTTARKELVLLHAERLCPPGLTSKWLRNRLWINGGHHHVQMENATVLQAGSVKSRRTGAAAAIKHRVKVIQAEIQKFTGRRVTQTPIYSTTSPFKSDFHRLARRLCGKSIGLVLGGGGARGIAHVGIIRAMEEAGIPIDIVGGTSIGAFVGALYAWDAGIVPMYGRIKRFAGRMGSMWRFALDLTYPSASYTTGLEFNRGIWKTFANYRIEDFWLPYYCNTTNISRSCAEYHNSGHVWRYVRASMSLAGLLPPLCDDGNMLLDGGYIDNLTVAHMKSLGCDVIFAVDVGSLDDHTPQTYGDSLSGFWSLWNRWDPLSNAPNPPTLGDIQSRLAYVSSVEALERAKTTPGCHYMRPPIDPFGTLAFGEFDEIYKVGYEYGQKVLAELREQKVLPLMEEAEGDKGDLRRTRMSRRASV